MRMCHCDRVDYLRARDLMYDLCMGYGMLSVRDWVLLDRVFGRRILPHEYNALYEWLDTECRYM